MNIAQRISTQISGQFRRRDPNEFGYKFRTRLHNIGTKLYPILKFIFPNFISAHYGYIISLAIIMSIMVYPVKNMAYIDALFLAAGAVTQAGLNTVDLNKISLYQQLITYLVTMFCTPIFIHSGVLFLRLYWFERHFDNIKESSKLNFKMRRTATLAARTQSFDSTFTNARLNAYANTNINTQNNQNLGFNTGTNDFETRVGTEEVKMDGSLSPNTGESDSSNTQVKSKDNSSASTVNEANANFMDHMSEPSDSEDEGRLPPDQRGIRFHEEDEEQNDNNDDSRDIKFGSLPLPSRRTQDVDPSDMYMSIAMLQKNHRDNKDTDEDEAGPALVIKTPAEIEKEKSRPIFNRKNSINIAARAGNILQQKLQNRLNLKRTTSNMSGISTSNTREEDTRSINSEPTNNRDSDDEEIQRAQSHIQLPSPDATRGLKYGKRSNTLEVPTGSQSGSRFKRSPTFEKIRKGLNRRSSSGYYSRFGSAVADTDEESNFDGASLKKLPSMSTNYLSWNPTVGRNSTFVHLTEEQKEELGGVEYRAVKLLCKILVVFYLGFHIIGFLFFVPWIQHQPAFISDLREQGIQPTWWAFFTSASAFNDLGLTLTSNSMVSFCNSIYTMLIMSFFIVIGNTGFPIFLRFVIWIFFKCSKPLSLLQESLGFLLDHPRRCFTLLFPSIPSWWLFFILVVMNGIDWILFLALDFNSKYLSQFSGGIRVVQGLFQAFSTRTAGFSVIDLSQLHPAIQVSYMLMMYISVLPLAISIRRTNVYEEQSLGVYYHDDQEEASDKDKSTKSFIGQHVRKQLSFDLWFVFLGLFIICIVEGNRLRDDPNFTIFQIMFEVVSAYGTVGLSLGYPGTNASFSGQFKVISKLVIIAMMIRGRHRGLPYALDRAIMLPSDSMNRRDEVQAHHAIKRQATMENSRAHDIGSGVLNFVRRSSFGALSLDGEVRPAGVRHSSFATFNRGHKRDYSSTRSMSEAPIPHRQHDIHQDVEEENAIRLSDLDPVEEQLHVPDIHVEHPDIDRSTSEVPQFNSINFDLPARPKRKSSF